MEGLLHWDFSPGLALANQVRHNFGTTVHFSSPRNGKVFVLVVSFSSASFPLNEDSVGIALQCCLGGLSSGFSVRKIYAKTFRFSVANNKVGHFIYGLKDRVWPDFVCHFHLFKGRFAQTVHHDSHWHADEELVNISARRSMAIKTDLSFLGKKIINDSPSGSCYLLNLVKFDPINSCTRHGSQASASQAISPDHIPRSMAHASLNTTPTSSKHVRICV